MGTKDGLAKAPYIRESRRIKAVFTVTENHVGIDAGRRGTGFGQAEDFADSVGIGYYRIDLHPEHGQEKLHRHRVAAVSDPARGTAFRCALRTCCRRAKTSE